MKTKDIQYLSSNQYNFADKLHARWDLYEAAIPKIDIHQIGIQYLCLKGTENILEVGCGDGSMLVNLRRVNHKGRLVGLEINDRIFCESVKAQQKENFQPPIEFIIGSADNLPFPDGSFDIILAFFMLYHMSDIQQVLREWKRVLKNNGKVLIATASTLNKPKHKVFKKVVEAMSKTKAPQLVSSFNLENAEIQLGGIFEIADNYIYEGQIKINTPEPYLKAFTSARDMYEPVPLDADWNKAEKIVRTEIEKEIRQNGFFTDNVVRGFFICEKKQTV